MATSCKTCKSHVRENWIKLHLEQGISIPKVAKLAQVHENTPYGWKARYLGGGFPALHDKSRAPHNHPNEYSLDIKEKIRELRRVGLKKEKRYLGPRVIAHRLKAQCNIVISPSGIGKFLEKDGLIPASKSRRRPKKERIKICRIHEPGSKGYLTPFHTLSSSQQCKRLRH